MNQQLIILALSAIGVYLLVFGAHAIRPRTGLAPFYALLGGITAIMSWVTDAGLVVQLGTVTFVVGSTVFYTALLLGAFVVYVYDGPPAARTAILIVAAISILTPLTAGVLQALMGAIGAEPIAAIPSPSLRINTASVLATVADLFFLAIAWEFLGRTRLKGQLWLRVFLTLLGVMWLDVLLFATGAFAGTPHYLNIMKGTLTARLIVAVFASPLLYAYVDRQNRRGAVIEQRPALAILHEMAEMRVELGLARDEIERRRKAEAEKEALIQELRDALAQVHRLEGLLPICSSCKRIRVESSAAEGGDRWMDIENYVRTQTTVEFTHGLCGECMRRLYTDLPEDVVDEALRRHER